MKIRPFFAWYDLWVGFYFDRKNRTLYFCPIPCVGLRFIFAKPKERYLTFRMPFDTVDLNGDILSRSAFTEYLSDDIGPHSVEITHES